MNTSTKFAGFSLGLVAVFGIALGIGTLVGNPGAEPGTHHPSAPGSSAPADPSDAETSPAEHGHGH